MQKNYIPTSPKQLTWGIQLGIAAEITHFLSQS